MIFSFFWSELLAIYLSSSIELCVRDDKYGWGVVEKSINHCVVRWVLNSFDFYLLSYKIIDMYIQRPNFSYFGCIYLLFRLVQCNKIIGKSKMSTPLSNKNLCHSGTDRK